MDVKTFAKLGTTHLKLADVFSTTKLLVDSLRRFLTHLLNMKSLRQISIGFSICQAYLSTVWWWMKLVEIFKWSRSENGDLHYMEMCKLPALSNIFIFTFKPISHCTNLTLKIGRKSWLMIWLVHENNRCLLEGAKKDIDRYENKPLRCTRWKPSPTHSKGFKFWRCWHIHQYFNE